MKKLTTLLFLLCVFSLGEIGHGMATEQVGPDSEHPTTAQPGWAKGIAEIPRHKSRVYSIWCNGGENFYFKADTDQTIELIALFSKARMRDHLLIITGKKENVKSFKGQQIDYNVRLNMTEGILLGLKRSGNKAETFEPVLTIYTEAGSKLLRQLKLRNNLIVQSDIQDSPIKSPATKPSRKLWHGSMQFRDGDWTEAYTNGLVTNITLWQKGIKEGIEVARVGVKGSFSIALSADEIDQLNKEQSWLTITTGNWLTEAKSDNLRISPAMLNTDKTKVKPIVIGQPGFYHGRIIFEDGSAPVLDPMPWPGAEIMVDFSYAGSANIDHKGYFQVFFTDEQYETLKSKKTRRNIYIPSYTKKNQSTAKYAFPVSLLSKDKSSAGVVKIPRPETFEK